MMNSTQYTEMVERRMLPTLKLLFPTGNNNFQHDLAPCHKLEVTNEYFYMDKINFLEWPGNSIH